MSDHVQREWTEPPPLTLSHPTPDLPEWLVRRFLRPDEEVTWVRGPGYNPHWERYVTHPALFVCAVALGAVCVGVGCLLIDWVGEALPLLALTAVGLVLGSIIVLGFFSAYFTRLVVTSGRILILQGYEVRRQWGIEALPPALIRYSRRGDWESKAVDLDAVQAMLGSSSDQFVSAREIWDFSKQLGQITSAEDDRS